MVLRRVVLVCIVVCVRCSDMLCIVCVGSASCLVEVSAVALCVLVM